jgi:putative phosphoribosyl transferase
VQQLDKEVVVEARGTAIRGTLTFPREAHGLVIFAHGSGSSRHSPRNRFVAGQLNAAGLATLLLDLLSPEEDDEDRSTARFRFDIGLLSERVVAAIDQTASQPETEGLPQGLFGASTGGAAALVAAAARPERVGAVVIRGGRPDLAGDVLPRVAAPTLLIVGGADPVVLALNREAAARMTCERRLHVIPGAGHLFEEPTAIQEVARLARDWFVEHLVGRRDRVP